LPFFIYLSRKLAKFSECLPRREIGLKERAYPGTVGALAAEPGGEVRNRVKGANCLSAASFCPAGCAPRWPGSSQQPGCPFFWFFSLGTQRKECPSRRETIFGWCNRKCEMNLDWD